MKSRSSSLVAMLALAAVSALNAGAVQAAVYHFELQGLNTAADDSGNVIAINGQGNFDTTQGTVKASGSYMVDDSTGAVTSRGTWAATDFVSFDSGGGVNNGFQTGLLDIDITLRPKGGALITGVAMSVFCEPGEVPGPADADSGDGTTVGGFTLDAHGFTLFQLIRP
jgi:hypothetical protein